MNYHEYAQAKARIIILDKEIDELFERAETDEEFDKARQLEKELEELQNYVSAGAMIWEKDAVKPLVKAGMASAPTAEPKRAKPKSEVTVKNLTKEVGTTGHANDHGLPKGATVTWLNAKKVQKTGIVDGHTAKYARIAYDGTVQRIEPRFLTLV